MGSAGCFILKVNQILCVFLPGSSICSVLLDMAVAALEQKPAAAFQRNPKHCSKQT